MDYSQYTEHAPDVKEIRVKMSDGISLKVIDFNHGDIPDTKPVIVFIAGWISLITGWKDTLRVLTSSNRVLYVESREKNSSEIDNVKKASFTMERFSRDISDIVEKLLLPRENFILAGSSLGATAILEYCSSGKRKPSLAVLISPNASFRFPALLGSLILLCPPALYFTVKPLIKWYLRNFRLDKKNSKDQIEKYETTLDSADPYKLKRSAKSVRNYSLFAGINSIEVPCLVIGAATDMLHGTGEIKSILKLLPYSTYMEMKSNSETHSEKAGQFIAEYIADN